MCQIGGYIKYGTLCNPLNLFYKVNIYANVKKRLYDLLFNVIIFSTRVRFEQVFMLSDSEQNIDELIFKAVFTFLNNIYLS